MKYIVLLLTVLWVFSVSAAERTPDLVLHDTITDSSYRTYRGIPFDVPIGVIALEVRFDYTGREAKTTIDVGLLGPGASFETAFRGWSGGNKRAFVLSSTDATPSYLSGPITPGKWQLLLGIPNIRAGQTSDFTAEVYFKRKSTDALPSEAAALRSEAGWYRGDLHMHTGHSDGSCASTSGENRSPCPLFLTLDAAAARKLDFIALTEHNTNSHVRELTALQPYFDRTLLIPGVELTTFQGHANAFNLREPVDFRVGSADVPDWNALVKQVLNQGAIVSINHPRVPTGEACMGCGWSPTPAADLSLVQAVEVVNGRDVETSISGIPFWHEQLQHGHHLTAIGGSDTHDVAKAEPAPIGIGMPTTVVYASELSVGAITEGIRSGRVFVDAAGSHDRTLEFSARHGEQRVTMGGKLEVAGRRDVTFAVRVTQLAGGTIEVIRDAAIVRRVEKISALQISSFQETFDTKKHWLRINVRDQDGRLALIGNPIYIVPRR